MEITIDLTFLLNTLIFIARKIDFGGLFAIVFCLVVFFTVAKIALSRLAEKPIRLSAFALMFYLFVGGVLFAFSYTELKFVSVRFTNLAQVLCYSLGESMSLIAIYVSFLCFSAPQSEEKHKKAVETDFYSPKTYKGRIEEIALNSDVPVLKLKTHSANEQKIKIVDIGGALEFVDTQIALGKSSLKPIRDKIAFYSGAELEWKDILDLNELFSRAVKL